PLPPMPTPNFFTLGRTMTQLALASKSAGTLLPLSISCSTAAAFWNVSSSFSSLAAQVGRINRSMTMQVTKPGNALLAMRPIFLPNRVCGMGDPFLSCLRSAVCSWSLTHSPRDQCTLPRPPPQSSRRTMWATMCCGGWHVRGIVSADAPAGDLLDCPAGVRSKETGRYRQGAGRGDQVLQERLLG